MKVAESRISKANVCPYRGNEIPGWKELGLDPERIYRLYRDPDELRKGASSFDGKPLLIRHIAVDAGEPQQSSVVGSIGKCTYEHPYLVSRPLTVWTQEAIDLIESEEQRELSSAYRYDALMVPGNADGQAYDGRMINIRGNHVAIVSEGRAGPDVHVADESPDWWKAMSRLSTIQRILAFIKPGADLVALDAALGEVPARSVMTLDEKREAEDAFRKAEDRAEDAELSDEEKELAYERHRKAKDKKAKDKKAKDAKHAKD